MNHWARMLCDLPALGQRTIARAQRVSLPRGCDATTRQHRLRQALCRATTVRATYALLLPEAQQALQHLRSRRGGISPTELTKRYGPVRSWPLLAADPTPRSISEQLLLLGWLLPRPAAPRHPPRLLVPPELRHWLPKPLPDRTDTQHAWRDCLGHDQSACSGMDASELPSALRATHAVLLACVERPRDVTQAGCLRRAELRTLETRLGMLGADRAALLEWLLPLLIECELLEAGRGSVQLTPVGQRFLALPAADQHAQLLAAWINSPRPDAWLRRVCADLRGVDWPVLRRRLCAWGAALPANALADPARGYERLACSLGPLADAQTHGYRTVERAPWQPRRAANVFAAALQGPLAWLGLVGKPERSAENRSSAAGNQQPSDSLPAGTRATESRALWRYGAAGEILVPYVASPAVLRLLLYARWVRGDANVTTYRITPATLARAIRQGWSTDALWSLLAEQAGPVPAGWDPGLAHQPMLRLVRGDVLIADAPALLQRAGRARSVRRQLEQQLAPGIALVRPEQRAALLGALERQGIACAIEQGAADAHAPGGEPYPLPEHRSGARQPARQPELTPGERAALLVTCVYYRAHAPADTPLLPHDQLEARLREGLSPQLAASVEAALRQFSQAPAATRLDPTIQPPVQSAILAGLRAALERQGPIELTYDTAGQGAPNTRIVRPIALEERGDAWYLRAYCSARQAERTFRVDRIGALRVV